MIPSKHSPFSTRTMNLTEKLRSDYVHVSIWKCVLYDLRCSFLSAGNSRFQNVTNFPLLPLDSFDVCRSSSQLIGLFAQWSGHFAIRIQDQEGVWTTGSIYRDCGLILPDADRNVPKLTTTYYNQQICKAHYITLRNPPSKHPRDVATPHDPSWPLATPRFNLNEGPDPSLRGSRGPTPPNEIPTPRSGSPKMLRAVQATVKNLKSEYVGRATWQKWTENMFE